MPSGERSNASGSSPIASRPTDLRVARSITSAAFDSAHATSSFLPSGVTCTWRGRLQVATVPVTACVFRSITVSVWSFSLDTYAVCACEGNAMFTDNNAANRGRIGNERRVWWAMGEEGAEGEMKVRMAQR